MSDIGGVFYRYVTILQLIPHYPSSISTTDLLAQLEAHGISVTSRSLQRDLGERLSVYFPLICQEGTRPYRWSLDSSYDLGIPVLRLDLNNTFRKNPTNAN